MFETLQKLDNYMTVIPNLLERMRALKEVHNNAMEFNTAIKSLKQDHDATDTHITDLTQQLNGVCLVSFYLLLSLF